MSPLAAGAADQYARRRDWLSRQMAVQEISHLEAEAMLRPWLHLAAMAGANIPGVYEDGIALYPYDKAGQSVQIPLALTLSADERLEALQALTTARDKAFDAADPPGPRDPEWKPGDRLLHEALHLDALARHLGAPPYAIEARRAVA